MPTYEFRCPNGHDFDRFFKTMSSAPLELPCPKCGSVAARQLSGGGGLVFKGSGFYLTDYGKNAHRKAKPDAESGAGGAGAAGANADAKGDAGGAGGVGGGAKPDAAASAGGKSEPAAPKSESASPAPAKKPKPQSE